MKSTKLATLLAALAFSPAFSAETDPVGFVSVTVPANSDAVLAVPLNRAAEFKGVIQSISGNTITVAGTPAWATNAFAPGVTAGKTYAIQIASGSKEGLTGRVTANTNNTLTVTVGTGDDLTNIGTVDVPVDPDGAGPLTAQADQVDVMPYWTPGTFLPTVPNGSELYSYVNAAGNATAGINSSPSTLLVFDSGSGEWLDQNDESSAQNLALPFGSAFNFRNKTASPVTLSMVGSVPMSSHRLVLRTQIANVGQDLRIGYFSPVPELLSNLGFPAVLGDQIFVYNNSAPGINKSPATILIYDGSQWLDGNDESPVPTFTLQPGSGYVFRLAARTTPTTIVWKDIQSYLN